MQIKAMVTYTVGGCLELDVDNSLTKSQIESIVFAMLESSGCPEDDGNFETAHREIDVAVEILK